MDARKLRHFLAVATEGSVTKAAEVLYIAQPSLSQSIRALEQELKTPLFYRQPRSLRLTPAGEALLGPARQALRAMRDAEAAVEAVAGLHSGRLELAVPRALAVHPTTRLVSAFHHRHPEVLIQINEATNSAAAAEQVSTGVAEVSVTELSTLPTDLRSWPLIDYELHVVLPPESHPPTGETVTREYLRELALISLPVGTVSRGILDDCGAAGAVRVEVRSTHALLELVLGGVGAGLVIGPYAAAATARGAHAVPLSPPLLHRVGVALGGGDAAPAAEAFVRTAIQEFRTE